VLYEGAVNIAALFLCQFQKLIALSRKKIEQNFKSVFTFVQGGVRMKLLKDMRSEENEHCKVN